VSTSENYQQAAERPAPKLRTLAPGLDRDLETICAKCLEREPTLPVIAQLLNWRMTSTLAARTFDRARPVFAPCASLALGAAQSARRTNGCAFAGDGNCSGRDGFKGSTVSPFTASGIAVFAI